MFLDIFFKKEGHLEHNYLRNLLISDKNSVRKAPKKIPLNKLKGMKRDIF